MDSTANTEHEPGARFREEFRTYTEHFTGLGYDLELDDEDLEELAQELYQSARKDPALRSSAGAFPSIDRSDAGAPKKYRDWFMRFTEFLRLNGMEVTINPDKILGFPKIPELDVPEFPDELADDASEEAKTARSDAIDTRNNFIRENLGDFKKFMRRYQQKVYWQNSLRQLLVTQVSSHNETAFREIKNIPLTDISGYMSYIKLKVWAENAKGRDLSVIKRDDVLGVISKMNSTGDVTNQIKRFKEKWAIFVEQFSDDVTSDDPEPWTSKLSNDQINNKIFDNLPNVAAWDSYKSTLYKANKSILDGPPVTFLADLQEQADMLDRGNPGKSEMPASVHDTNKGKGGKSGKFRKKEPGTVDCFWCQKEPKGVPSLGHKPSSPQCPHHEAWKASKQTAKTERKKKQSEKSEPSKNGGELAKNEDLSRSALVAEIDQRISTRFAEITAASEARMGQLFANVIQVMQQPRQQPHFPQQPMLANVAAQQQQFQFQHPGLNYHGGPPPYQPPHPDPQ